MKIVVDLSKRYGMCVYHFAMGDSIEVKSLVPFFRIEQQSMSKEIEKEQQSMATPIN